MDEVEPPTEINSPEVPATGHLPTVQVLRRVRLVEWVGLALIVLLLAALIVTRGQVSHQDSLNTLRASALTVATSDAVDVATYDYQSLSADFGRVEAESTPQFKRSFEKSSAALSKVLTQYKASAKAVAIDAGVSTLSSSQAVVLVFIDQSVDNTAQKSTSTDDSRVRVTLKRSGGKWLLAHLTLPT